MADLGTNVIGLDSEQQVINNSHAGVAPLHEPGLAELLDFNINSGRLRLLMPDELNLLMGNRKEANRSHVWLESL